MTPSPTNPSVPDELAPILDLWLVDDEFARILPALTAYAGPRCTMNLDPDEIDITGINAPNGDRSAMLPLLYCDTSQEHVDLSHPAWTAILVLRASGHRLGLAKYRPTRSVDCCEYPPGCPRAEIPVQRGHVLILNDHHTHWLTAAPDVGRFIGLALEFDDRPTRAAVMAELCRILAAHEFPVSFDAAA